MKQPLLFKANLVSPGTPGAKARIALTCSAGSNSLWLSAEQRLPQHAGWEGNRQPIDKNTVQARDGPGAHVQGKG